MPRIEHDKEIVHSTNPINFNLSKFVPFIKRNLSNTNALKLLDFEHFFKWTNLFFYFFVVSWYNESDIAFSRLSRLRTCRGRVLWHDTDRWATTTAQWKCYIQFKNSSFCLKYVCKFDIQRNSKSQCCGPLVSTFFFHQDRSTDNASLNQKDVPTLGSPHSTKRCDVQCKSFLSCIFKSNLAFCCTGSNPADEELHALPIRRDTNEKVANVGSLQKAPQSVIYSQTKSQICAKRTTICLEADVIKQLGMAIGKFNSTYLGAYKSTQLDAYFMEANRFSTQLGEQATGNQQIAHSFKQ